MDASLERSILRMLATAVPGHRYITKEDIPGTKTRDRFAFLKEPHITFGSWNADSEDKMEQGKAEGQMWPPTRQW